MQLDSDEYRALESTITALKRVLLKPHVRGTMKDREDRRRMAAADQLAEIRGLLESAISTMEAEGLVEMSVVFAARHLNDLKPRVRRRGKKNRMERLANE
jgi:hypothetical protein